MKRKSCLLLSLVLLIGLAGCTQSAGELEPWQGKWYDVNSDTVLDIRGDQLTFQWGEWADKYTIHLEEEGSLRYLNSDEDYAFGLMSKLQICEDGSLRAYEQILDAPGYQYKFVREEALAVMKGGGNVVFDWEWANGDPARCVPRAP